MKRMKELFARSVVLLPIVAIAASPSLPAIEASYAAELGATLPELQRELADMSTGQDQELMLAGTDAQSRNALIPLVGGTHTGLSAYSPFSSGSDTYSTALKCMTQAVYYEAANETETGKRAVAQVVMNRMRHPAYPNSVCGVIYQGVNARVCQFSFTCDGALLRKPLQRQWSESLQVAEDALAGKQLPDVGTATHYHADYVVPKWAFTLEKLKVIGTHIFYRFPGRAGRSAAFQARWSQSERIPQINWARFDPDEDLIEELAVIEEEPFVPGLTVTADPTDRHAPADVGGRLDTTKQWRLSIPDPVNQGGSYAATVNEQGETPESSASVRDETSEAEVGS
ncbi:MAG: cell wall hydrolase [Erythrobacter sp.]|nr:cell wall hydrolase [Erythrobacter sp.]